jgi:phosphoadenosine phosphosulfate reductase
MNITQKKIFNPHTYDPYENYTAEQLLEFANNQCHKLTIACSFGAEDVVLVDLVTKINPQIDIFFLDTHLHFRETYEVKQQLEEKYGIQFIQVATNLTLAEQEMKYGAELWNKNPDQCCDIRKVAPLANQLKDYDAWITGIRREQSLTRAHAKKVEDDLKFGLIKYNPLADWTYEQVWKYIKQHHLIYHSLHDQNFPSIGCYPCTRKVSEGEDIRAGRWSGLDKTECGLHKV